jgi:hypothetical protein
MKPLTPLRPMKYLVEIIPESISNLEAAAAKLATTLKLEPAKAAALLKRNPVTKPVSQAEAEKVARLFSKAGIEVFIRGEDEVTTPFPQTTLSQETASPTHEEVSPQANVKSAASNSPASTPAPRPTVEPPTKTAQPERPIPAPVIEPPNLESLMAKSSPGVNVEPPAKIPSVVPEINQASSRSESSNTFAQDITTGDESFKLPSGFFTPVPEPEPHSLPEAVPLTTTASPEVSRAARGGVGKLLFASILPGLLALAGVFTVLYLLGLPLLRAENRSAAQTTAVSLASSIGGWIGDVSLTNPTLNQQVQRVIETTRGGLRERGIDFVLLTDVEGNQLAGWHNDTLGVPDTISNADVVRNQVSAAIGGAVASETGTPLGADNPNNRLSLNNETLELASHAVLQGTTPVGAVVVGSNEGPLTARLQSLLLTTILAGVLPLLLGMLLSLLLARNRS